MKYLFVILLTISVNLSGLNAQSIKTVQRHQKSRIAEGIISGKLTRSEARKLRIEQNHIRKMEEIAKADGVITRRERILIRREQRRANKHITRLKNN